VAFPVDGVIYGENNRLMVCLPCRRAKKSAATVNVWFIVDTGSNITFLAKETIEALIREDDPFPPALRVAIQVSFLECF
jgi:mevalonate pyrophosphate decarboxylase